MQDFGEVCRRVRMALGLSQVHVARTGNLQQARVSEIEHGVYTPGLDQALKLAKGMGVKLADLVAVWEGDRDAVDLAKPEARGAATIDALELDDAMSRSINPVLRAIEEIREQTARLQLNAEAEARRAAEAEGVAEAKVDQIIRVVDEMQMQTRLLGLNAAAETKRAEEASGGSEQGTGSAARSTNRRAKSSGACAPGAPQHVSRR
jgi:transcriptional regulator with XRE-family HTH domain